MRYYNMSLNNIKPYNKMCNQMVFILHFLQSNGRCISVKYYVKQLYSIILNSIVLRLFIQIGLLYFIFYSTTYKSKTIGRYQQLCILELSFTWKSVKSQCRRKCTLSTQLREQKQTSKNTKQKPFSFVFRQLIIIPVY